MTAVEELLKLLDLETLEVNLFRGHTSDQMRGRVFGGQVVGQALVAACRTVEASRPPHSLHAYFLLGGDPKAPIIYDVDRIRDGKSFTTRRVVAIQHGEAIFTMAVSFHVEEDARETHQSAMPKVPMPDELPSMDQLKETVFPHLPENIRRFFTRERPIEMRPVDFKRYLAKPGEAATPHVWMRAAGRLPDDRAIHQCVLAYASDMALLDAALAVHGRSVFDATIQGASLDHALWFHRPFRADEWLLYVQDSPNYSGALGFSRGALYTADGTLVASVAQEGLLRERRPQ
jgi:acyl-CoA thioesterase-2